MWYEKKEDTVCRHCRNYSVSILKLLKPPAHVAFWTWELHSITTPFLKERIIDDDDDDDDDDDIVSNTKENKRKQKKPE